MDRTEMNLQSLPLETLQHIAGYLNSSHQPSLFAFSLASKTCYRAATLFIFRHIHLTVHNREILQQDVDALDKSLSRSESARYVQSISIKGTLLWDMNGSGDETDQSTTNEWFASTGLDEILGEEPAFSRNYVAYDEAVIQKRSDEDLAWTPLVQLIKGLPCLDQLVYECDNQFPPSLLETLQLHPQCKLHHLTFRLRTLLWGVPYPYEMSLATSPCLSSVRVIHSERDSDGDDDFNQEAVMELVAGLAPNLKEVTVVNVDAAGNHNFDRPRAQWRGLPGFVPGQTIGSLTSLSLIWHVRFLSHELLETWSKHTDFSVLRHLTLGGGYGYESIGMSGEVMDWTARNCSFSQLKTLSIRVERGDRDNERLGYGDYAVAFFTSIPPLEELSITGPLEPKIIDAILEQHGEKLKKLSLHPREDAFNIRYLPSRRHMPMEFTKKEVLQIQAQCPVLEELAIPIKRMQSNAIETETYKIIGKMNRLRSLFLTLDCSDWRVISGSGDVYDASIDPSFNEEDRKASTVLEDSPIGRCVTQGHVRAAFINSAVDETLARSIWETISQNKAGRPLDTLRLWTTGGGHFGTSSKNGSITLMVENMSRSWLFERIARHDDEDIVNVKELGGRAREMRDQRLVAQDLQRLEKRAKREARMVANGEEIPIREVPEYEKIFHRIWPHKDDNLDWRQDWSSFPLQA